MAYFTDASWRRNVSAMRMRYPLKLIRKLEAMNDRLLQVYEVAELLHVSEQCIRSRVQRATFLEPTQRYFDHTIQWRASALATWMRAVNERPREMSLTAAAARCHLSPRNVRRLLARGEFVRPVNGTDPPRFLAAEVAAFASTWGH
jgi:predicted DNA-binding transcriptional regulator AlpA